MRYAIYLTPPKGSPLAGAAAVWLGRSPFEDAPDGTGTPKTKGAPAQARADIPARYGFHATMRAPFRLAEGYGEEDLLEQFDTAYGNASALQVPLEVSALRHFVALTAKESALAALSAAEGVALETFEPMRAPLTPEEVQRRKPQTLDGRGRELLDAWGYPHVRERFTFHMTLSGPIDGDTSAVVGAAKAHFAALLDQPQTLVHAVFREDEAGGPFRVIAAQPASTTQALHAL